MSVSFVRLVRAVAAVALAGGVVVGQPASVAAPAAVTAVATSASAATGPTATASPAPSARVDTVTLITGDQVQVRRDSDGRIQATLVPTAGATRTLARTVQHGDSVYVFPLDAESFVASGALDRELFNVSRLVDAAHVTDSVALPLIVTYGDEPTWRQLAQRTAPEPSRIIDRLPSIDGMAVRVSPESAQSFWRDLRPELARPAAQRNAGTAPTIWLDKVVTADLDKSVPQIGAPEAWDAGYDGTGAKVAVLDTGYDPTHPDLEGQVADTADFSGEGIVDRHGHGTHVAATVAGTGSGSDGLRVGVAPGADLLIGKVMDASGTGMESWLIEGMEWTVTHDADVVNMSLSTDATDGSDPVSQAVDQLSATSDTLFVATAGNTGPDRLTSRWPGNADSVLSVAAVDKSDAMAGFSSRGPRPNDYAVKPDIAAPGVDIVAARAAGTSMDRPVDDLYTMASGTSMAAPHVAGAAAILAGQHPAWDGERIKAALMSTSLDLGESVYATGAGRVDVARAVTQPVSALDGSISFGRFPYSEQPVETASRTVTYVNDSDSPIQLDLTLDVADDGGDPAPGGVFTLDTSTVTVPADGTASVQVTLDPNVGTRQLYGGQLEAVADGVRIHTAVGAYLEPEMVDLVIDGVSQDGQAARGSSSVDVWNLDTDAWLSGGFGGKGGPGPAQFRVPVGTYSISAFLWNMDETGRFGREVALVAKPEITIDGDTHLVLDATGARRSDPITPRPTEHRELTLGYYRSSEDESFSVHYLMDRYVPTVYLGRTDPVSRGEMEVSEHWELYAAEFAMSRAGQPVATEYAIGSARVDGSKRWGLIDVGQARPSDLAGLDLRGKLALVENADDMSVSDAARAVAAAGAAAALVYYNQPGFFLDNVDGDVAIPTFTAEQAVGVDLRGRLSDGDRVSITVDGTPVSPYAYDLFPYWNGSVPATIDRRVEHDELARFEERYHGMGTQQEGAEIRFPFRPYDTFAIRQAIDMPMPSTRTEWVTPGEITWQLLVWAQADLNASALIDTRREFEIRNYGREDWFAPVVAPGVPVDNDHYGEFGMPGYRDGDTMTILIRGAVDSRQHYSERLDGAARFYRNGVLIAEGSGIAGSLPASPGPARYRLELDTDRDAPWWRLSTRTRSAWEFGSERPATGKRELLGLLQVDYDVPTNLMGRIAEGRPATIGLAVHRQGSASVLRDASLRLWVSYDEGTSWRVSAVQRRPGGEFRATVTPPKASESVSLRVHAADSVGNALEQDVIRAVGVQSR
jgi:subtilisin family serine protease